MIKKKLPYTILGVANNGEDKIIQISDTFLRSLIEEYSRKDEVDFGEGISAEELLSYTKEHAI